VASSRSIPLIGAGILALVVLVVAVVLLAGDRVPQQFPADSPGGLVQRYLAAWERHDYAAAYGLFSSRVKTAVPERDYRASADDYVTYGARANATAARVFIDGVTDGSTRVTVRLTVEELSGSGLDANVVRFTRTMALVKESAGWRIDEALLWLDPGPYPAPM
jgi:ketosteroid isomerase-like protein